MQPVSSYNPIVYPVINEHMEQPIQYKQCYPQQQPVTVIYQEHTDLMGANSYQESYNQGVWSNPDSWYCGLYLGYGDTRFYVPNPHYYESDLSISNPNRSGCSCCRYVINFANQRFQCSLACIVFLFFLVAMIRVATID